MIATTLGGIGLFLLGMVLLTDGLKATAGDALRRTLQRFTGGPFPAFLSGAGATVLVQSSSATILATIGFVSAGLLTFPQAIGVIFGAAVGTTSTGWIVSLVGLKLTMSVVALPLVGVGALLRLLGRGRAVYLGTAVAGFGLIFVGIDTLQAGMRTLGERLDPTMFPGDRLTGRVLLIATGLAMTVVMQSSSAAVATTLAALHAGTLHLEQAALLVIGQNIGTAVTAALASLGASVPARRTAAAHIGFNLLAVAILLPLTGCFGALVRRVIADRGPVLTRHLDASVANLPAVAVEAARRTVMATAGVVFTAVRELLRGAAPRGRALENLPLAEEALRETRRFLAAPDSMDAEGAAGGSGVFHEPEPFEPAASGRAGTGAERGDR